MGDHELEEIMYLAIGARLFNGWCVPNMASLWSIKQLRSLPT
jgi:hypothetical protein